MKTKIALSVLVLTMATFLMASSLVNHKKKEAHTSAQLGSMVISALAASSYEEYIALFPTNLEIQEEMAKNKEAYGMHLKDAQADFAVNYRATVLPLLQASFDSILAEAKKKGIDWASVKYAGAKSTLVGNQTSIIISFQANGAMHQIVIEKALVINGNWRISQFAKLS